MIKAVLFDLDGTFADTAPDLAVALNKVREENELSPLPLESVRLETSNGAHALIQLGFGIAKDDPAFSSLKNKLLQHYSNNIAQYTTLFDGMDELLDNLDQQNIAWGIVTNKPQRFTQPLMQELGITHRTSCIVSGDTTPYSKPHPASLIHAAKLLSLETHECMYIGDAERDIEAAKNAGMKSLIALFGYLRPEDNPASWGADGLIETPAEILKNL